MSPSLTRHAPPKSPLPPLFQRGEFLPLVKGGKEGFNPRGLHNDGLTNKGKGEKPVFGKDTYSILILGYAPEIKEKACSCR